MTLLRAAPLSDSAPCQDRSSWGMSSAPGETVHTVPLLLIFPQREHEVEVEVWSAVMGMTPFKSSAVVFTVSLC